MYSSPNAVGPIALLESFVVEYVDDYVKDNFDDENDGIDTEDDKLVDEIYNNIIDKINIKYLRKVVYWRLEELADEREKELCHKLMNDETIKYKSSHKLYANITNSTNSTTNDNMTNTTNSTTNNDEINTDNSTTNDNMTNTTNSTTNNDEINTDNSNSTTKRTKIYDIYELPNEDCDLFVLLLNAINYKSAEEPNIEVERINENDFILYVVNDRFKLKYLDEYSGNPSYYTYKVKQINK